jgi:hypothetical protein
MKRLPILAAIALVAVASLPAAAHVTRHAHAHPHRAATPVRADIVRDDINRLDADIDQADARDTISEREASDLRKRLRKLRDQFHRYNANGLTLSELNTLEARANYIRSRLRMERYDWDHHAG